MGADEVRVTATLTTDTLHPGATVNQALWPYREPPELSGTSRTLGEWRLTGPSVLTGARHELSGQLDQEICTISADETDRLLLTFEELASNGLRHGRTPVTVRVIDASTAWLIDVSDAATERPPLPAIDRDPAHGGMGLRMVASLCQAHGWTIHAARKHVWGCIQTTH